MEKQRMKQAFMESAVRVVARERLEKATAKSLAAEVGLNKAYIYKCFSSKDELLSETFHLEDERFAVLLRETRPVMHVGGLA